VAWPSKSEIPTQSQHRPMLDPLSDFLHFTSPRTIWLVFCLHPSHGSEASYPAGQKAVSISQPAHVQHRLSATRHPTALCAAPRSALSQLTIVSYKAGDGKASTAHTLHNQDPCTIYVRLAPMTTNAQARRFHIRIQAIFEAILPTNRQPLVYHARQRPRLCRLRCQITAGRKADRIPTFRLTLERSTTCS